MPAKPMPVKLRSITILGSGSWGCALASVVAVPEVLNQAASVQAQTASPAPLVLAAGVYVALFLPLVRIGRWLETRFHIR